MGPCMSIFGGGDGGDDEEGYQPPERKKKGVKTTLEEVTEQLMLARNDEGGARDTQKRLTILKNLVVSKRAQFQGKWKTVEFQYQEVLQLERLIKGFEGRLTYVINNLARPEVGLRAEKEVKLIKNGRKDLGLAELVRLIGIYNQFQAEAISNLEARLGIEEKTDLKEAAATLGTEASDSDDYDSEDEEDFDLSTAGESNSIGSIPSNDSE